MINQQERRAEKKDRYEECLERIPEIIDYSRRNGRHPLLGFSSNLDVVLTWNVNKYNKILSDFLRGEPEQGIGESIGSMEDFARITSWYIERGLGGNADITDITVCDYLQQTFSSELSLGGTCAQAAAALGTMGFPVDVHLTDRCETVCKLLDNDNIMVIRDGVKAPAAHSATGCQPVYHFILQFKKDDVLEINGRKVKIPVSNRLILFYDAIHKRLPIDEKFYRFCEEAAETPSSYLLSGFDAIVEPNVMAEKLAGLTAHIRTMRQNHPDVIFYLEGAFYLNPDVKHQLMDKLAPLMDVVGMNEEELAEMTKYLGEKINLCDEKQVISGMDRILGTYKAGGIVLHTKDYALYYGKKLVGIDIEQGLVAGNLMSATRARTGCYGTLDDCRETLSLPISAFGQVFAEKILRAAPESADRELVIVPSKYMEYPKYTIGLGDTFTAGVQSCFIRRDDGTTEGLCYK